MPLRLIPRLCAGGILLAIAGAGLSVVAAETFPYTGYVVSDQVYARSGPGKNYYPTDKLERGSTVEVYRHDPGGWYAIRPPKGSFSWVSAKFVDVGEDSIGVINGEKVMARVGSSASDIRDVIQVQLDRGEELAILEAKRFGSGAGAQTWYKIAPPAGEFRWVFGKYVDVQPPQNPASRRDETRNRLLPAAAPEELDVTDAEPIAARGEKSKPGENEPADRERGAPPTVRPRPQAKVREYADRDAVGDERRDSLELGDEVNTAGYQYSDAESYDLPLGSRSSSARRDERDDPRDSRSRPYERSEPRDDRLDPRDFRPEDRDDRRERWNEDSRAAEVRLPPRSGSGGRPATPEEQNAELDGLDEALSVMVTDPVSRWSMGELHRRTTGLLSEAESALVRARARRLLAQIEKFEDIRRRQRSLAQRPGGFDSRGLQMPLSTHRSLAAHRDEPDSRYDGIGKLTPVTSQTIGAPRYALIDERGAVRYYVTPAPGISVRRYLGQQVGINGNRGFVPELNSQLITARRIVPLDQGASDSSSQPPAPIARRPVGGER